MTDHFDDIINLPHPDPKHHQRMPMLERAAQFLPFAALTGYDDSVREEARLTDKQVAIGEDAAEELDRRMALLREHLPEMPLVTITYFVPDSRKDGGRYLSATGRIKKMDDYGQTILLENNPPIAIQHVLDIESELFQDIIR